MDFLCYVNEQMNAGAFCQNSLFSEVWYWTSLETFQVAVFNVEMLASVWIFNVHQNSLFVVY
jgi:hypothetical protein